MKSNYEKRTGHSRTSSKKNDGANATARRKVAMKNLEITLNRGTKCIKGNVYAPLTEKDAARIKKEIEILKSKI
jgi:hypothetical protein